MTKEEMAMWARLHDAWKHYEPEEMSFEEWLKAMESLALYQGQTQPPMVPPKDEPTMAWTHLREDFLDLLELATKMVQHIRAKGGAPHPPKPSPQTEMFVDWFGEDSP